MKSKAPSLRAFWASSLSATGLVRMRPGRRLRWDKSRIISMPPLSGSITSSTTASIGSVCRILMHSVPVEAVVTENPRVVRNLAINSAISRTASTTRTRALRSIDTSAVSSPKKLVAASITVSQPSTMRCRVMRSRKYERLAGSNSRSRKLTSATGTPAEPMSFTKAAFAVLSLPSRAARSSTRA